LLNIGIYLGILIGFFSGLFAFAFLSILLQPSHKDAKPIVKMSGLLLGINGLWFGALSFANIWVKFNNNKEQFISVYLLSLLIIFFVCVVISIIYLLYWQPKKKHLERSGEKVE